jgi:hypothetical protein
MAIRSNPNLFTGGAVTLDSQPYVNFAANLMAKEQAKSEAFDEYLRNLNKSVNGAGLRNADREAFDAKLADWRKFGIENKSIIRKDPRAQMKFQTDYQDLINLANESKALEEKKKPFVEIMLDPVRRDRLGDGIFKDVQAADGPILIKDADGNYVRNKDRKELDYSNITFNPKPFEQDKYFQQYADIKRTDLPPTVVKNPTDMTQTITTKSVYDPEAKNIIGIRAASDYASNPSFREVIKNVAKNPEAVADFNKVFKESFGRDIDEKNPYDLATAFTLKGLQSTVTTSKLENDTFERQKNGRHQKPTRKARMAMQDRYVSNRIAFRSAKNASDGESVLNNFIDKTFDEGEDSKDLTNVKGNWVEGRKILVPTEIKDKYILDKGYAGEKRPIKFIMTNDKKFVVPVYPGQSSVKSDPIPIDNFKADLGKLWLTKKDQAGELGTPYEDGEEEGDDTPVSTMPQSRQSAPQPSGYSRKDLKANGWTDKQIDAASKAGKIKVH